MESVYTHAQTMSGAVIDKVLSVPLEPLPFLGRQALAHSLYEGSRKFDLQKTMLGTLHTFHWKVSKLPRKHFLANLAVCHNVRWSWTCNAYSCK